MNKNNEIEALLNQKLDLFCQYEKQTNALIDASEDCVDNYITKRDELANSIDVITKKIIATLQNSDEMLINAVYCRGNYSDYDAEQAKICDIASKIFGCINRITEKNSLFTDSLSAQKDATMDKIKLSKNTPKIKKYLGALGTQQNEGILSGNV